WVRGQEATLGPYSGRPLGFMLQIAEEGMAISPNACSAGMGHLVAARAQLLALLGRRDEALATVRQVEALYDRLPDPQKGDTGTIMTWTLPRTLHTLSYVATFSGSPDDADRAQTAALAAYPASATRSRAQVRLHQAVSAVRSGDI